MPTSNPDLLSIEQGAITAPAGCGKTHLISEALKRHTGAKPILVLTHTNAGVAALRARLAKMKIDPDRYKLGTIDGWCMRVVGAYPTRSGVNPKCLSLRTPNRDYPHIKAATTNLLNTHDIDNIIAATYERLIVDEYQDCTIEQHEIVRKLNAILPTCVLGDPLQAIFGFAGKIPNWKTEVLKHFSDEGTLDTPWRWKNAGTTEFGNWLLHCRSLIATGRSIHLDKSPDEVSWVQLDGHNDMARQIKAGQTKSPSRNGSILIIANSIIRENHWRFAKRIGAANVVESADLRDFIQFADGFDITADTAVYRLVDFAGEVMSGVEASNMKRRIRSLLAKTARNSPTDAEDAALNFHSNRSPKCAADLLEIINQQKGVYCYRRTILNACIQAFRSCSDEGDFAEMAVKIRERNRHQGRILPLRAVGSTLLMKGLEADVSVILETDRLSANELYVAMTRGCRKLVVCSRSQILKF